MTRARDIGTAVTCLAALALLLGGCAHSPPSRYHLLPGENADRPLSAQVEPATAPIVLVDRVTLASYADRTPLVTRAADGGVSFGALDAWAAPPAELITQRLVEAMAERLGPATVLETPPRRDLDARHRLIVDVRRFDIDAAGPAVLDARWTLLEGPDERAIATGRERILEPVAGVRSPTEQVRALSRTVGELGRRLAVRIEGLSGP